MDALLLTLALTPSTSDPSGILVSATDDGEAICVELDTPATASRAPDLHAFWSVPAVDVFGAGPVHSGDQIAIRLWSADGGIPDGMTCMASLTDGPLSATSRGASVGLEWSITGAIEAPKVARSTNNGSGWITGVASGYANGGIVGAEAAITPYPGSIVESAYVVSFALDPRGEPLWIGNTAPAAVAAGIGDAWDTFSVGCGWSNTAVAVPAAVHVAASLTAIPLSAVGGIYRTKLPPDGPIDTLYVIGQSNAGDLGTASPNDTTYGWVSSALVPVPAAYTFVKNGVRQTTWGRRPGPIPYLFEEMVARGVTNPVIVLEALGGQEISPYMLEQRQPLLQSRGYDLGQDAGLPFGYEPDAYIYVQGEDDCKTAGTAAAYEGRLRILTQRAAAYNNAPVLVAECGPTCDGYGWEADVRDAQVAVCDESAVDLVELLDTTGLPLDATLHHYSPNPGGGFDQLAERVFAALEAP